MAFVNNEWLTMEEREERIKLLSKRINKLKLLVQSGNATDYHRETLTTDIAELKKLIRVQKAEKDVGFFAFEYLSDQHNPENDDNIIRNSEKGRPHEPYEKMAIIHRNFYDLCNYVTHEKPDARLAIGAPRGHSKSGVFSNALILHALLFRRRRYILVISETDSLSKKLINYVNLQLKTNKKIIEDFGELMYLQNSRNEKDNEESFITTTGALVEASSSGKALRGKRHGAYRPDLVIIDDPSSANNEGTREAREKLIEWFNSVVEPIGGENCSIILVGTMVSSTGLLNHVLKRKDFKSILYDAILSEPDNPHLWEQYLEIYSRSEDMSECDEFYEKHKEEMEAGVEVAWSWRWTYRDLMHKRVDMGTKSFNSEYRNRAYSEDERFFFPERFAYYQYKTNIYGERVIAYADKEYSLKDLTISAAWDIAMGKNSRSCYNSVVFVGRDEKSGLLFVIDEYSSKEQPHIFMEKCIEMIRRYRPNTFRVETINAYHEFYRQLQERLRVEGIYYTKVIDAKSHKTSKEQRIESLEPLTANKTLVFNERHKILLSQMEEYPNGDFLDAVDALQMATEIVARRKPRVLGKPRFL